MDFIFKKRRIIFALIFLAVFLILSFVFLKNNNQIQYRDGDIVKLEIRGEDQQLKGEFLAELSLSNKAHYLGLSNRESLNRNKAMLFVFENKAKRTFVMRDMNFPLDIIFLSDNKIIDIYKNLEPEGSEPKSLYSSSDLSNMVLEINGGLADSFNLKENDYIVIGNIYNYEKN